MKPRKVEKSEEVHPAVSPVLRIDDAGRRAAARTIAKRQHETNFDGNRWIAEMYSNFPRVKDVVIDRTGGV